MVQNPTESDHVAHESPYQELHERGVVLSDESIDFITQQLRLGIYQVVMFMDVPEEHLTMFSSDEGHHVGYCNFSDAGYGLNIPVPFLNGIAQKIADTNTDIEQLPIYLSLTNLEVPFPLWLRYAGREEAIHHLQRIGCKGITQRIFQRSVDEASAQDDLTSTDETSAADDENITYLLSAHEVEARELADVIGVANGDPPIWKEFDRYLKEHYPDGYNKPIFD